MEKIKQVIIIALIVSILGYIFAVLREKYYLKNNIIIINSKVSNTDLEDLDIKQFSYKGLQMKSGDEIKITTNINKNYKGTLLGGKFKEGKIKIVKKNNEILEFQVKDIYNIKIIRKYGKFFT